MQCNTLPSLEYEENSKILVYRRKGFEVLILPLAVADSLAVIMGVVAGLQPCWLTVGEGTEVLEDPGNSDSDGVGVASMATTAKVKHKILLDDYKVRPELNKHKNI